jgi:hypothetical protein
MDYGRIGWPMENIDELIGQPISPVPVAVPEGPAKRFARNWDFLAVLLIVGASIPLVWISPSALVVVPHPGTFDDHWVLDTAFKTSRGIWFGRDVAFPYGPLFQWLFSASARWAGLSMGAVYTAYHSVLMWVTCLFGFLALRLLIPEQPAWKRFLLLILLSIFWAPWDGRTAFDIFLFALFLRGWYAVRDGRLQPAILGCGAALFCAAAFLYSADTGVFGVAALVVSLAGVGWEDRHDAQKLRLYAFAVALFAASSLLLTFLLNAAMGKLLDFGFWRRSLALVAVHRWNEPASMSDADAVHLLVALVVGGVVLLLRWLVVADRTAVMTARAGFLLSAFAFAVLAMQSGLVRSDHNHIVFAVFPIVFFAGTVLFSFQSRLLSSIAVLIAVSSSVLFAQPAPAFRLSSLRYLYAQFRYPLVVCPSGFSEFDHACYPARFTAMLQDAANYVQRHVGVGDSVLIFPYQYMFAMASSRDVAGGVEQSFLSVGPYLTQLNIAAMQRAAAPAGLYFPDGTLSLAIDDVPNFTRNPEIWFWIFRHYRSDQEVAPEVFGLQRDQSRAARISVQPLPLGFAAQTYPIRERSAKIDLDLPYWPNGADFLRLRLTAHYSPLWKLRKPERLQLEIGRADGSHDLKTFVVDPNVPSDVWFYPWSQADLAHYFSGDELQWRTAQRPAITQLRVLVTPFDWVSQQPDSIVIESADAVKVSLAPQ